MSNEELFIAEHQEQFNGWLSAREERIRQEEAEKQAEKERRAQSIRDQIANLQGELAGITEEAQG